MEPGNVTYVPYGRNMSDVKAVVEVGLPSKYKKAPLDMVFDVYHDHTPPHLS